MSPPLLLLAALCGQVDLVPEVAPLPPASPAAPKERWPGSDALMGRLAAEAEAAAKNRDPLAMARLYRLWNFHQLLERPATLTQALEGIRKTAAPLIKDHATYLLAERRRAAGRLEEASALLEELGLIDELTLIGPFDNAAGRGHEEAYPPERGEGWTPIRGKAGQVRWRGVRGVGPNGVVPLASLLHPSTEATAYVAVTITAAQKAEVVLRVGSVDQLAVFLDGRSIFASDRRRQARLDQDAIPLVLSAGTHLVVLKSSWLESDAELLFRFTAPQGGPTTQVSIDGRPEVVAAAFRALPPQGPSPSFRFATVLDGLEAAIERRSGVKKAEALALRADLLAILDLYDRRTLPSPPERDLLAAIPLAPSDPLYRFFYAHRVQTRDPNLAHEQLEEALGADPGFVPAQLALADLARNGGRLLEARGLLDAAIVADPHFGPSWLMRAALGFDELSEGALAALRLALAPDFENSASMRLERARMARSLGDARTAKLEAEATLTLDYERHLARQLLVDLLSEASEPGGAVAALDEALRLRPAYGPLWLKKARLLAGGSGRTPEAVATLELAAQLFPNDPSIPNALAELWLWEGNSGKAIAALDHSLDLDPHQPEVRQHRRALSGDKNELEDRYSIDAAALAKAKVSAAERQHGAIYLADRTAVRLYGDGKSSRFRQVVLRLRNPRLKDALRGQRIDYSPSREDVEILSAERIRPTGEVIHSPRIEDDGPRGKVSGMYIDQRFKTVIFDDLEEGDLIHLRYRIDSIGGDLFGGFFGDVVALQATLPKEDVLYVVHTPASLPIYTAAPKVAAPERSSEGDEAVLRYAFPQLAALDVEPYSPPYPEIGALISVSTYDGWESLGAWYAKLYREQLVLDDAAREAGRLAVQGASNDDEKIRRLYEYVVKNTRYVGIELGIHGWKPFPAAETHRRRYGDCKDKSTLLTALLRDQGIDAALTLVRTSDRGTLPEDQATMWAFNHAITYVPSKDLFLDPTAEFSGSTELPTPDQGAMALVVTPEGKTKRVTLPEAPARDNLNLSRYVARISPTTALELEGVERFFGARAAELRQELEETEQRRLQIERQLGQLFEGVQVVNVSFSDLANLEAPVEYGYSALVPRYGRLEGERLVVPVALFQHQVASAYAQLANRKEDLYLSHPWATQNVIRYELPDGAEIESLPEGITVDTPHVSLVQVIRKVEGGFETDDTVTIKSRIIPAADYQDFRAACLAIDRALSRKVVIKW